jgi:hypothetical protein
MCSGVSAIEDFVILPLSLTGFPCCDAISTLSRSLAFCLNGCLRDLPLLTGTLLQMLLELLYIEDNPPNALKGQHSASRPSIFA